MLEPVEVFRGSQRDPSVTFGPLPGLRHENIVAYEFELPQRFEPWPGRTRLERTFVLLDVGVSFAQPCWFRATNPDGSIIDDTRRGSDAWYVDLITIDVKGGRYTFRDLYIDVIVPTDGRHYRLLDLDEYADALAEGIITLQDAIDGLRRWQRFLDRYLHTDPWPSDRWSDFPPKAIHTLAGVVAPFGTSVRWEE